MLGGQRPMGRGCKSSVLSSRVNFLLVKNLIKAIDDYLLTHFNVLNCQKLNKKRL